MLNPRSIDDPVSSWGSSNEKSMNASGITFDVKFMGYVPIPNSISTRSNQEKDRIVKACVQSVVSSQPTEYFKELLSEKVVEPFFSVDRLKVFLNIANYTTTFLHIQNTRNLLLGRYRNNTISHYKTVNENGRWYIGMIMVKSHREQIRECNVLELQNETVNVEFTKKLQSIDQFEHTVSNLDARLQSTREYAYKLSMVPFYHGRVSQEEAVQRLSRPGDFLMRDMQKPVKNDCAISFIDPSGRADKHQLDYAQFLKNWQLPNRHFKYPVLRKNYE